MMVIKSQLKSQKNCPNQENKKTTNFLSLKTYQKIRVYLKTILKK